MNYIHIIITTSFKYVKNSYYFTFFSRGPYAFDIFRQALQHHYDWLSDDMDKLEESGKAFNDIRHVGTPTLPPISPLSVIREQKV